DNYITVEGYVNGTAVNRSGYLLDNITGGSGSAIYYRGYEIQSSEELYETLAVLDNEDDTTATIETYRYIKVNGVIYYYDSNNDTWFSMLNGVRHYEQSRDFTDTTNAGYRYYDEAREFTAWVRANLGNLKTTDAVSEDGSQSLRDVFGENLIF